MKGAVFTGLLPTLRLHAQSAWSPAKHHVWLVLWLALSIVGLGVMTHYDFTPGQAVQAPRHWPANSALQLSPSGGTLLVFVHPECPCTRATLGELLRICSRCSGKVTPWIVIFDPSSINGAWDDSDLWSTAQAIPGAHVVRDTDGVETRRFHVETSGQTLLYDANGQLQFSGGITASRGHAGDNVGRCAIESLLTRGMAHTHETPVFGCPILSDTQR